MDVDGQVKGSLASLLDSYLGQPAGGREQSVDAKYILPFDSECYILNLLVLWTSIWESSLHPKGASIMEPE